MINSVYECKSAKKWAFGFYAVFMLCLILAGVMLGIMDIAKLGAVCLFAGVFIACSIISLVVFCVLLHEINTWIESQKTYYVDLEDIEFLVKSMGFRDECDYLERTYLHRCCPYILSIDTTTGKISCRLDEIEIYDFMFAITDLAKLGILRVVQPVV